MVFIDFLNVKRLDLHDVKHEDARQKVIHFIEDNWKTEEDLKVITGHSIKMRGIVLNVLDEYNLPYNIGSMFDTLAPKIIFWIR